MFDFLEELQLDRPHNKGFDYPNLPTFTFFPLNLYHRTWALPVGIV
jgi:hypothetical protein